MIGTRRLTVNQRPVITECIDLKPIHPHSKLPVILVIPGNPAILPFYETFLCSLHEQLDKKHRVIAVNHLGHHSYDTHKESGDKHEFFGLNDQIHHKIAVVESLLKEDPETEFIFLGHSIGAYMVVQMLMRRPDIPTKKIYHLFPTLHSLTVAPFVQVLALPIVRDIIVPLVTNAPQFMKDLFIWMSGTSRDEAALSNISTYFHSSALRNVFYLVRDELFHLKELKSHEKDALVRLADKSSYLFTKHDPYVTLEMIDEYKQLLPNVTEIHKFHDELNIKHAFVLSGVDHVVRHLSTRVRD